MTRLEHQIDQLKISEAEYVRMAEANNALALAAETPGRYEKYSTRANDFEAVALRLAGQRRKLERRLAELQAVPAWPRLTNATS